MPDWLLALLASLTGYRLTRLVVRDDFPPVRRAREETRRWAAAHDHQWLDDLVSCHWCASGWVAIGLAVLVRRRRRAAETVCLAGAVWAVAALLAEHEDGKP